MSQYERAQTVTVTQSTIPLVTGCDDCQRINTSSSSTTGGTSNTDALISTIGQLCALQKDVRVLQEENKKVVSYYDSTTKLNKTVRMVVIILMIVPVIQLICCAGVVYSLGIEDELSGLLKWILSSVSVLSIVELIVGGIKLFLYEKRMDELENKINTLSGINNK